ncbi:MAG: nitrophenyl compound nitroreductase subunit ArsF family protein [Mangrovibacterium sp.]
MKKRINTRWLLLSVGFGAALILCGKQVTAQNKNSPSVSAIQSSQAGAVKAYYFHATRRCATCEAVESVTRQALTDYYGAKVAFECINRETDKKNPLIKKYQIKGQTLLIVDGDKVVNLTNDAFLNARTKPDKLKAKLKATIDPML